MSDVFLAYSRKDIARARQLVEMLEARELSVWVDWQEIRPASEQMQEYLQGIEASDAFVFLLSAASMASPFRQQELEHAVAVGKRLIPVALEDLKASDVPSPLQALNWIFFRSEQKLPTASASLIDAIETDQEHTRAHTWYQNRALEWERASADPAYLLRGETLEMAEAWLAGAVDKDPPPSSLQVRFLMASRQYSSRRQRRILAAALAALLLTITLGILAWNQRTEAVRMADVRATAELAAMDEANTRATAEAEAREETSQRATAQAEAEAARETALEELAIANSRRLAAQAISHINAEEIDQALLLAIAAARSGDTLEARQSLMAALRFRPHLERILYGDPESGLYFGDLAFSTGGSQLAAGNDLASIYRWEVGSGRQIGDPIEGASDDIASLAFAGDDQLLLAGTFDRRLFVWDLASGDILRRIHISDPDTDIGAVTHLAVSDESNLVAASVYELIVVLDLQLRDWSVTFADPQGRVGSLRFSPDGQLLASGSSDSSYPYTDGGRVTLWDPLTGTIVGVPLAGQYEGAGSVRFSPDGQLLASAGIRNDHDLFADHWGEIFLWQLGDAQTQLLEIREFPERTGALHFPSGGETLVYKHGEMIERADLQSGEVVGENFTIDGSDLSFSPDDQHLATRANRGKVYLWNFDSQVSDLEVLSDIEITALPLEDLIARACFVANRNLSEAEWARYLPGDPHRELCPGL